jgi:hypothetical protein
MEGKNGFMLVEKQDIESIKNGQQLILQKLEKLGAPGNHFSEVSSPYITAGEFMKAVRIRRWKFNCLVSSGKIMSIKKRRKIYVPKGEIDRYFSDVKE